MESPFENIETSRLKTASFLEESLNSGRLIEWETFVLYNQMNKPPLSSEELKEIYDRTSIIFKEKLETAKKDDELDEILAVFKRNKTEGTYLLAQHIVKKYNIITIGEKEREMYIYKDGMYYPGADNLVIYPEIQKILGAMVSKSAKSETYHKICDATAQPRSIFQKTPPNFIPLKNGVYDFYTNTLLPHSPEYRFTFQFPIIYDSNAKCPRTITFLDQVLTPSQRVLIEEWIGFYFWRQYMFKKAIIFVGAGDTGKTTLLEVITNLLGRENISSISLQKMTGDKFSAAHLYEKHGNLVDELSARDINDTGAFKMATGGGSVTGEYKFGNQFSFHNFSKFTFACNRIPDVTDMNDEAYFNRWMVVRFENPIKRIIPNYIETLTTEEERSGLFNLAMEGLKRLLEQKRFSYGNTPEQTKAEMMRSGSSIAMFVGAMLEKDFGYEMEKEDMYQAYIQYCHDNNLSAQTKDMLGKRLPDFCSFVADGQGSDSGKKIRVWRNARLKGSKEKEEKENKEAEKQYNEF